MYYPGYETFTIPIRYYIFLELSVEYIVFKSDTFFNEISILDTSPFPSINILT